MSEHHEIVIIRRGGHGNHDEHHGGVWKIAFADFMTAMMAFFLVLWLISANDKTRASVARYFNPVRLVDATTQPRGLHDSKKDDSGITASPDAKDVKEEKKAQAGEATTAPPTPATAGTKGKETPSGREKRLDAELRDNPYVALAEIVGDKGPGEPVARDGKAPIPAIGHGGAAFRDPFAPPPPQRFASLPADDDKDAILAPPQPEHEEARAATPAADPAPSKAATPSPVPADAADAHTKQLAAALHGLADTRGGPSLDVRKTGEGTLVSLTDTSDFAMFSNGSAVPAKKVVLMMEKIATLLKAQHGDIVIRGFTDNKKFRSARYDNWHLSIDRAQVAHYMLVRGGLADTRISHVEGYADHEGRSGVAPSDPRNRRIEILIKDAPA